MTKLADLDRRLLSVHDGAETHHTVLATRIRLSRNLDEPFVNRLGPEERRLLRARIFDRLADREALADAATFKLEALAPHERSRLGELLSFPAGAWEEPEGLGLIVPDDPRTQLMVGELDHLRIYCVLSGLQVQAAFARADSFDANLEELFDFSFSEEFGYLCASPWRAGTGLKASVTVHLPALAMSEELPRIFRALGALHFSLRDPGGLGPLGQSPWAEVANARCLGEPECVYLDQLSATVKKLDEFEGRARERLLSEARSLLEDRIWTAYGQLRYARLMTEDKALELLGTLRLGCLTELIQDVSIQGLHRIMLAVRDGQLQADGPLAEQERDERRAEILRNWLDTATV